MKPGSTSETLGLIVAEQRLETTGLDCCDIQCSTHYRDHIIDETFVIHVETFQIFYESLLCFSVHNSSYTLSHLH